MDTVKSVVGISVVVMLFTAVTAVAADNKPATAPAPNAKKKDFQQKIEDSYVSAYFGVNRNLGRAWVEVASTPWIDDPQRDVIARTLIKGLCYDPDRTASRHDG